MSFSIDSLKQSLETGFINKESVSDTSYAPTLLLNDKKASTKVLTTILHELATCEEYYFSVAFISTSGVAAIVNVLQQTEVSKVKGKILASQYLDFTHPEALKRLLRYKNIELRINTKSKHHAKGYIFKHEQYFNIIVGSSNLTSPALCENKELNIKTTGTPQSKIVERILTEFNSDFEDSRIVDEKYLQEYEVIYKKALKKIVFQEDELEVKVKPNLMQRDALKGIESIRKSGGNKAILISATGTGKTYLCAFDVQQAGAKKFLFIVHRENIASKALRTFRAQIGDKVEYGVYSGQEKAVNADFLFSTVQTLSREDNIKAFKPDHFDYIVIDETHRSGAESYKKILEYFRPRFLLGMTATPERTDGYDIFKQFDYNIAYEIRLHKALEENMLAPFHYYGVTEITVDGQVVDEDTDISDLTTNERVKQVIEKSGYYGTDTGVIRCLVFCRSVAECKDLSLAFNRKGKKSVYLTGESTSAEREEAIEKLQSDNLAIKIDYIFTYDIFNEGVDIPLVNQVILLRPTSSPIVFVQQIGRGLRKAKGKDYLTIIDFIGNYKNNYLIPIALFGDSSYNKDIIRKLLVAGSSLLPGSSTINFEKIAKERIFQSIDTANMSLLRDMKADYQLLKYRLGRSPMMMEFVKFGMRDPFVYVDKFGSFYNFAIANDHDIKPTLTTNHLKYLELFSSLINNGVSILESEILKRLIQSDHITLSDLSNSLKTEFGFKVNNKEIEVAIHCLNFKYHTIKSKSKLVSYFSLYKLAVCELVGNKIYIGSNLKSELENVQFKQYLEDSTDYSIYKFKKGYDRDKYRNGFVLYNKYTRKDALKILGWKIAPIEQNVGGYIYDKELNCCPIFVTYDKSEEMAATSQYEDEFISKSEMTWFSKNKRRFTSPDVKEFMNNKTMRFLLFVKKNDDEGTSFYYMGDVKMVDGSFIERTMPDESGKDVPVVQMQLHLNDAVNDSLFEYIITKKVSETV